MNLKQKQKTKNIMKTIINKFNTSSKPRFRGHFRWLRLKLLTPALLITTFGCFSNHAYAASFTVAEGFDLWHTPDDGGTTFAGAVFKGVPLNTFDFGDGNGPVDVGDTDTIVQRLNDATVSAPGETATIDIEMAALQLMTVAPTDLGAGFGNYFITLDESESSLGSMDITFDDEFGGTFDSSIFVDFDVRFGALDGIIVSDGILELTSSDTPWSRFAPPEALLIEGINHLLNGTDIFEDFWPGVDPFGNVLPLIEVHPTGAKHTVRPASPAPDTSNSLLLLGIGLSSLIGLKRRNK